MPDVPTWEEVIPETTDHGYINTATLDILLDTWEKILTDTAEHHADEQDQG
jgi:hypothetical protein